MSRFLFLSFALLPAAVFADEPTTEPTPPTQPTPPIALPNQPPTPGITGDWGGVRSKLADDGLTVAAAVYYDYSKNFQGGISTVKYSSREFFDLDVTFTTDQSLHWHGGTFFFNFLDHEGGNGSTALVGDAQGFDNQDGPRSSQIYQLYYQQLLANDQLRFKIGRIDATTDFAFVANGGAFIGSTFGYSPAITAFPTYPDPALGAALFWTPGEHFYATAGVDYVNNSDRSGILSGSPYSVRSNAGGAFVILELGEKWTVGADKLPGRIGFGGYHDTGHFARFDGSIQHGTSGAYAVFDQTIWQPAGGTRSAGIFGQWGLADSNIGLIDEHFGTGIQCTGPLSIPSRAGDVIGLGVTFAHFSHQANLARDHELPTELFYKLQLTPWFNVQPDLQYLNNPGGRGGHDAVVGTVRAELDF